MKRKRSVTLCATAWLLLGSLGWCGYRPFHPKHLANAFFSPAAQQTKNPNSSIPVLPLPRHVEVESKKPVLQLSSSLSMQGLPDAVEKRLAWHWQRFAKEQRGTNAANNANQVVLKLLQGESPSARQLPTGIDKWLPRIGDEGYVLVLQEKQRLLAARTEKGLFYGMQTLKQLLRAGWNTEITVVDWPDFHHRIVYDDISRGPVSTVDYIKQQIERMAELKLNGLSFYIEHVVQSNAYPDFAPPNGKLTIAQIKELSAYAAKFYMELMGSFQSFGHFEKILAQPKYASMGATSNLISPVNPEAKKFLASVVGEMCDAFSSPYFNVNCDETFDLGQGATKPFVDSMGAAAFYASHLNFLYGVVKAHGKKMAMWGDFALDHPEVLSLLPNDVLYLTWEYGDQSSYDRWIKPFADRQLSYMVCPGILNSYRLFPDVVMAKANITGFAKAGYRNGAAGVLTTIWDDGGTYLFSGDWYGVYVAAEKSWQADTTGNVSFDQRYAQTAYGTSNPAYSRALFTLMELRRLPLTYDLNDRLWQQKILPDSGRRLILNNEGADKALRILSKAANILKGATAERHATDLQTLAMAVEQYKLIIETRVKVAALAGDYLRAVAVSNTSSQKATAILANDVVVLTALQVRHRQLKEKFRRAWLAENQLYWLNVTLAPYDKKIADLTDLTNKLTRTKNSLSTPSSLPSPESVRLSIEESTAFYFQNWMLAGPFPNVSTVPNDSLLYADRREYNKPPSPGDFTQYGGKPYRWRKYLSPDGGIIDPAYSAASSPGAVAYAYCSIATDSAGMVPAFFSSQLAADIYCNGQKLAPAFGDASCNCTTTVTLPLKAGVNHLFIRLKKQKQQDNASFTFRLGNDVKLTNHKHKYHLNPKTETHDAE